jgi:hypothetical protein
MNPGHHAERVISPGQDDAAGAMPAHDGAMQRSRAKQLRRARTDVLAGAMLVRAFAPHLVRMLLESIASRHWVRNHVPRRRSQSRRSLKIGAFAVGGAAAGLAAVRIATHRPPFGDDEA